MKQIQMRVSYLNDNKYKNHLNLLRIPPPQASQRHGGAGKFPKIVVLDTPRGCPVGGGGVHHNKKLV
jgi:hypothetical protein